MASVMKDQTASLPHEHPSERSLFGSGFVKRDREAMRGFVGGRAVRQPRHLQEDCVVGFGSRSDDVIEIGVGDEVVQPLLRVIPQRLHNAASDSSAISRPAMQIQKLSRMNASHCRQIEPLILSFRRSPNGVGRPSLAVAKSPRDGQGRPSYKAASTFG